MVTHIVQLTGMGAAASPVPSPGPGGTVVAEEIGAQRTVRRGKGLQNEARVHALEVIIATAVGLIGLIRGRRSPFELKEEVAEYRSVARTLCWIA